MSTPEFRSYPANRIKRLDNATCVYCARVLGASDTWTKEHVIARKFVPRGTLDRSWNLIVRTCTICNGEKADLEDDISALTMQPDAAGLHARNDPQLFADARRKANGAYSRRTSRKIKDSAEQITLTVPFLGPETTASFTFKCAPPTDEDRVFRLAWYHIQGFFYMLSYEQGAHQGTRRGGFLPGQFLPLADARRADWGNALLRGFADATSSWHPRLHGITANGFFRVCIRRRPEGAAAWSWALEWNSSHRIIGLFGDPDVLSAIKQGLPLLHAPDSAPIGSWQYRFEERLLDGEDHLFAAPLVSCPPVAPVAHD